VIVLEAGEEPPLRRGRDLAVDNQRGGRVVVVAGNTDDRGGDLIEQISGIRSTVV
jgi:hypothetical protein